MIEPIILNSEVAQTSLSTFNQWLNEPVTLIVVLGNEAEANQAVQVATEQINTDNTLQSVRVIQAYYPAHITQKIETLRMSDDEGPINGSTLFIAISGVHHVIGKVISKVEFDSGPAGSINLAVLFAEGADQ